MLPKRPSQQVRTGCYCMHPNFVSVLSFVCMNIATFGEQKYWLLIRRVKYESSVETQPRVPDGVSNSGTSTRSVVAARSATVIFVARQLCSRWCLLTSTPCSPSHDAVSHMSTQRTEMFPPDPERRRVGTKSAARNRRTLEVHPTVLRRRHAAAARVRVKRMMCGLRTGCVL